jgi:16S rRNA (cytosine1402-N4)-methyltransferase
MDSEEFKHIPVLAEEVLQFLGSEEKPVKLIDATVGCGGHSSLILRNFRQAAALGIDRDGDALNRARKELQFATGRFHLARGRFSDLKDLAAEVGWTSVDMVLFDLGVSSPQLDDPRRGFSLRLDGPLDMRMDQRSTSTASRLINRAREKELEEIFRNGEVRKAGKLAKAIVEKRKTKPFTRTMELVELCEKVLGKSIPGRLPTPTLCFQAIRIAVNEELAEIEKALEAALEILEPGGRIAAISFHSLEDRIVKNFFKRETLDCICPPGMPKCICDKKPRLKILTKKPLTATVEEIKRNPRSSCAKLRVAEKIGDKGE